MIVEVKRPLDQDTLGVHVAVFESQVWFGC